MIKATLIATFACANLITSAAEVEDPYTRTQIGPWTMACEKAGGTCSLVQAHAAKDAPQPLKIGIELMQNGEKVELRIQTSPIAQPRVRLRFENLRAIFLENESCEADGCEFAVSLSREAVADLEKESLVEIAVAVSETEGLALTFDISGLKDALARLPRSL